MVNEVNNGHNFSLNDFVTLANNTQDQNKELRIRKSNGQLSNSGLGSIAKHFGSTHKNSNISVNRAFIYSLKHDPKYSCIADKIGGLFTEKSLEKALTPNKVKATISTADNILKKYETASSLADQAAQSGMIPANGNAKNDFKNYVFDYLKNNPESQLSSQDFTAETTLEQKKAQIKILSDILSSYFEKTHAFEDSPNFTLTDTQCNDPEKKKSIMNMLNNAVLYESRHNKETYERFLHVQDNDLRNLEGSPFKAFEGAQQKRIKAEFGTKFDEKTDYFYLSEFTKEDIEALDSALKKLNKHDNETLHFKKKSINTAGSIARIISQNFPDMDSKTRTTIMKDFCQRFLDSYPQHPDSSDITASLKNTYAESLLENGLIRVDGEDIFQKYGIDAKEGMEIINNSDFGTQLKQEIGELKDQEEVKEHLTREVGNFLKHNAEYLRQLNTESYVTHKNVQIKHQESNVITRDLRSNVINSAVITRNISDLLNSEQPDSPDILLNSFISLNHQLKDLSGQDSTRILDDVINNSITSRVTENGLEFLGEEEVLSALKRNKDNFNTIISKLHAAAADPKNRPIARFLNETAALAEAFYNRCIINASGKNDFILDTQTTDPKYNGIFLQTTLGKADQPPLDAVNADLNPKAERLNTHASKMDLIVAEQLLNKGDKYKDLDQIEKDRILDLMHKTSCDNLEFMAAIADDTSTYSNFIEGFATLKEPGDSAYHHLNNFNDVGVRIRKLAAKTGVDMESIRSFFMDTFFSSQSLEDLEAVYTELTAPKNVAEYEVLNNLSLKEMYTVAQQGIAKGAKNMAEVYDLAPNKSAEGIQISLDFLDKLKQRLEKALNKNSTGPLYNYSKQVSFNSIPYDDMYQKELLSKFPNTVSELEIKLAANKVPLSEEEKGIFTDFFNKLKLPGGKTAGELSAHETFEIKYKSIDKGPGNMDKMLNASFDKTMLSFVYAPYAKEISELCRQNNNNPSPQQLWTLIHGGEVPADLTAENLNEKLYVSLCCQTEAYGKMIGRPIDIANMGFYFSYSGVPIFRYLEKMKDIATGDVTFTLDDQTASDGIFKELTYDGFLNGADNYGFGLDFHRCRLPYGANDPTKTRAEQEGMTLTVVNDNQTVTFTRKEQLAHENKNFSDSFHPYINRMVQHIEGLCKSKEQLAMVGALTTQLTNNVMATLHTYYKDVAGAVFEHVANDFVITKDGDNLNVKITSKPGAKYTYSVEYVVGPDGTSSIREGSFTLPKVSTAIGAGEPPYV